MSKPFNTTIEGGIAEMILDHPPVNAFDSAGWFADYTALIVDRLSDRVGHWLTLNDHKIDSYQCIVPTTWN